MHMTSSCTPSTLSNYTYMDPPVVNYRSGQDDAIARPFLMAYAPGGQAYIAFLFNTVAFLLKIDRWMSQVIRSFRCLVYWLKVRA